ncbi:MAG: hypothetical protein OEY34_02140 [Cyclobacteriaceae bacterium]|nr:hypothetical protein [Cyclobacteriaceae bacterium]
MSNGTENFHLGMHPELLKLRAVITESLAFGQLKHETFDNVFKEINSTYVHEDLLMDFISKRNLRAEFEQFCSMNEME